MLVSLFLGSLFSSSSFCDFEWHYWRRHSSFVIRRLQQSWFDFFQSVTQAAWKKNRGTPNRSWNYDLLVSIPDDDNIMIMASSPHNIRKGYLMMNIFLVFTVFHRNIIKHVTLWTIPNILYRKGNIFYTFVPARGWKKIQGPIPSLLSNTWIFFRLRLWI